MLFYLFSLVAIARSAVVNTPYGTVRGFDHRTFSGKDVEVYLGIQYAKPPVGYLRLEKPEIVDKWTNEFQATDYGPSCYVYHRTSVQNTTYSEDCLSINVITPKERQAEKLPVLLFIHGGGFGVGDAHMSGYKHPAENFVAKGNIIYIFIQYRLGFLGFLASGDDSLPGNLGLWDQALALKFIKEVVPSFGGDAGKITISGQSAGSASVTAMLISPHSNKYFSQAIQMSASLFSQWSYGENVVPVTSELSEAVNCNFNNKATLKACLKAVSVDDFFTAMDSIVTNDPRLEFISLHPHFDGDFFPEAIDVLLEKAPKKKTIQGVTDDESTLFTVQMDSLSGLFIPEEKRAGFSKAELKAFIDTITPESDYGEGYKIIRELASEFYSSSSYSSNDRHLQAYCDLLSDLQFSLPVYQEVQQKIRLGWETYAYVMKHPRAKYFNPASIANGTLHGDELPFLMDFYGLADVPLRPIDEEFKEVLLSTFISFVKTGNPSTSTIVWRPATAGEEDLHVIIGPKPEESNEFFRKEAAKFWLETVPARVGVEKLKKTFLPGFRLSDTRREEL